MALTVTVTSTNVIGGKRCTIGTLALDSSYPSNGYTISHDQFAMMYVDFLLCDGGGGYNYQVVSGKLKVWLSAGVEASGNLSSVTGVNFIAYGS